MSMNPEQLSREQRRHLRRMGAINEAGAPVRTPRTPPAPKPKEERTTPRQFLREVKGELRKVAWPTKEEVRNYSIIVLIAVVLFTTFVALLDYAFGLGVLWLYDR
jgi:preprotein translocase subunit SecE